LSLSRETPSLVTSAVINLAKHFDTEPASLSITDTASVVITPPFSAHQQTTILHAIAEASIPSNTSSFTVASFAPRRRHLRNNSLSYIFGTEDGGRRHPNPIGLTRRDLLVSKQLGAGPPFFLLSPSPFFTAFNAHTLLIPFT